jgi:hypothetical protein
MNRGRLRESRLQVVSGGREGVVKVLACPLAGTETHGWVFFWGLLEGWAGFVVFPQLGFLSL